MRSYLFSVVAFGLAVSAMVPGAASAQDTRPAALVDTISITVPGVQAMDYVRAGTRIDLGADGKLVIDYLASCIREEIVGGTVQVGAQQSAVDKGKVTARPGHGEFVSREPHMAVNKALSTWKEVVAPRKVERTGIPATGV